MRVEKGRGVPFLPAEQVLFMGAGEWLSRKQIATDQGEPYAADPSCLVYRYVDSNVTRKGSDAGYDAGRCGCKRTVAEFLEKILGVYYEMFMACFYTIIREHDLGF